MDGMENSLPIKINILALKALGFGVVLPGPSGLVFRTNFFCDF